MLKMYLSTHDISLLFVPDLSVDGELISSIGKGIVALIGIHRNFYEEYRIKRKI